MENFLQPIHKSSVKSFSHNLIFSLLIELIVNMNRPVSHEDLFYTFSIVHHYHHWLNRSFQSRYPDFLSNYWIHLLSQLCYLHRSASIWNWCYLKVLSVEKLWYKLVHWSTNTDMFQLLIKYEYSYMSIIDNCRSSHYKLLIILLNFYLKDKSELSFNTVEYYSLFWCLSLGKWYSKW